MKKMLKVLAVVVVLLVFVGVVAFVYIDQVAKGAIEQGGSYALGVNTEVERADVEILRGQFRMRNLRVANPEGFHQADHFLLLGRGGVEVSLNTLMNEVVTMPVLRLGDIDLNLLRAAGKTNYGVILENLKRFETTEDKTPDEGKTGKRFIVEKLVISNVVVHAELPAVPGTDARQITLPIDRIVMRNVGAEENRGVLLTELAKVIIQAVAEAIVEQGGDILPTEMINNLRGELAKLTDLSNLGIQLESALPENIEQILKDQNLGDLINENLGEDLKDLGGGLGDLLNGGASDGGGGGGN